MRRAVWLTLVSFLCASLAVAVALAQDGRQAQHDTTEAPPPVPEAERTPEDQARRAQVIARVGETIITVGEVEDAVNEQSPFLRARYRDPEQLRGFVDSMVRFELLARAAERAEVGNSPEVRRVVQQNAVQQLIRRDFDERITAASLPLADVQQYFDTHPAEFNRPELRRAAHIQVASREEAVSLMTKARTADAREFRRLAREHSLDPETRLRGGDLRYFDDTGHARNERDPQVDTALVRAAFAITEVGGVSPEPIQVGERWSILKLTGRRPAEHRSFEQSEPTIRLRLWRERRQDTLEDFVERLKREAHVAPNYDLLRPIRLDPPEREDAEEGHGILPGATPEGAAPGAAPIAPGLDPRAAPPGE
jgi:peptidyl-prolyl cis-trans isomerase C